MGQRSTWATPCSCWRPGASHRQRIAACLKKQRSFLAAGPPSKGAALEWLRVELRVGRSQVVTTVCKAPNLSAYSTTALHANLAWWQMHFGQSTDQLSTLLKGLRSYPEMLNMGTQTLR